MYACLWVQRNARISFVARVVDPMNYAIFSWRNRIFCYWKSSFQFECGHQKTVHTNSIVSPGKNPMLPLIAFTWAYHGLSMEIHLAFSFLIKKSVCRFTSGLWSIFLIIPKWAHLICSSVQSNSIAQAARKHTNIRINEPGFIDFKIYRRPFSRCENDILRQCASSTYWTRHNQHSITFFCFQRYSWHPHIINSLCVHVEIEVYAKK